MKDAEQPAEPIWSGVYASFDEARAAVPNADAKVFDGAYWVDREEARVRSLIARRAGGGIPSVASTSDYVLPLVAGIAAGASRRVRVLDFGGSMAATYVPARAMVPAEIAIELVVVESEALCKRGSEVLAGEKGLRFQPTLPTPPERFDVVHFGSSLHYVEDWRGLLAATNALEPEWLVFADLTAADNRTFVTLQRFQGRRIPVNFWNLEEMIGHVRGLGFDLLFQSRFRGTNVDATEERPTANFDEAHRLRYTTQLVFRRARASQ